MGQSSFIVVWSNQWFVIWAQNPQHVLNNSPINEIICIITDIIVIIILQAIRQWDQALREKNDYRDALAKVKRKCDDDDASLWYQWYHATNQYLICERIRKQLVFEQTSPSCKNLLFCAGATTTWGGRKRDKSSNGRQDQGASSNAHQFLCKECSLADSPHFIIIVIGINYILTSIIGKQGSQSAFKPFSSS